MFGDALSKRYGGASREAPPVRGDGRAPAVGGHAAGLLPAADGVPSGAGGDAPEGQVRRELAAGVHLDRGRGRGLTATGMTGSLKPRSRPNPLES